MQVDPRTALEQAYRCLTSGHFENSHAEGARTNALESIAWSLVGLLQGQVDGSPPAERPRGLQADLERAGLLRVDRHR